MLLLPNAHVTITRPSTGAIIYTNRAVMIDDPEDAVEQMMPWGVQSTRTLEDNPDSLWQYADELTILDQGGTTFSPSNITVYVIGFPKVEGGLGLASKIARLQAVRFGVTP